MVVTHEKFRMKIQDAKKGKVPSPCLIGFIWSNGKYRNIMSKVINPPEYCPIMFFGSNIEIFSIKEKYLRELLTILVGELIVVGKSTQFFMTNLPCFAF